MSIQNREYVRDRIRGGTSGSSLPTASLLSKLIGLTVFVYILQIVLKAQNGGSILTEWMSLNSDDLYFRGQIWRLLTYAFVHNVQSPMHLVMNMITLYSVGRMLTNLVGERELLFFYLASAVFAGICSVAFYTLMGMHPGILGASGAVYAVFCVVAMHYPRQQVLLFGTFPIEMRWLLAAFAAIDAVPTLMNLSASTQVAHSAHLGGLLFGFLYVRMGMNLSLGWDRIAGRVRSRKKKPSGLRIFAPPDVPESRLAEQMDEILEKISRDGERSLTLRERNLLTQASRQLRKDRMT
ncbi:MAG: rhomboid family intramembrane serine protease [Planctomycetota bacterium]